MRRTGSAMCPRGLPLRHGQSQFGAAFGLPQCSKVLNLRVSPHGWSVRVFQACNRR
ncbi:conserved protein of unknown function [Methylorubrum extorquens]|uniref:Uncharacterized protein n=1 Tax=Methylorubrum extorquens TaxID=408 RepID=A0A2N9AX01_METEX|nr:conserved protein of unknown function [Methylorubrum extorquens]